MNTYKNRHNLKMSELAKLLGHAVRIEILTLLMENELSVEALSGLTNVPIANISQHLQNLRKGNFVTSRRDGKYVIYSLTKGPINNIINSLSDFIKFNDNIIYSIVDAYKTEQKLLESVSQDELIARLEIGAVTLLDVRTEEEYTNGHIPGALNIPLVELAIRLSELPKDTEIVAYCRGPHCILSVEAVNFLKKQGYKIKRLNEGYSS